MNNMKDLYEELKTKCKHYNFTTVCAKAPQFKSDLMTVRHNILTIDPITILEEDK